MTAPTATASPARRTSARVVDLDAAVAAIVAQAPPLTPEQADALGAIFRGGAR
ncbi:hypothetical protein [Cellulosimicrobium sp. JZ28]|uniref:hypothetical protein n=1 Tax=Cellulosimicrobium sp. JZ28 TaxID=1906273 RepID=UPI00188CBC20|nr:hypothetical protein [Cellulosimicrobium sp. JZ28]